MLAFTDSGFAASSSPVQFIAFLLMGALVGWLFNDPLHGAPCCAPLAIIGVCGAWFGGEFAYRSGLVERGGWDDFAAAFIGAAVLAWVWRRHHAPDCDVDPDIAAQRRHA